MSASDTTKRKSGEANRIRDPETGDYASKLNPETIERITNAIRVGATLDAASRYGGITRDTFYRWLGAGRKDDAEGLLREFADAIDDALAGWEVTANTLIAKAAQDGVWQAAAWSLERRKPDEYGRRMRLDANVTNDPRLAAIGREFAKRGLNPELLSNEELDQLMMLMEKMLPGQTPLPVVEMPQKAIEA
jgi:hypothetical protein